MRYDWAYKAKHLIADSTRSLSPLNCFYAEAAG